jgi:hypothetical protein
MTDVSVKMASSLMVLTDVLKITKILLLVKTCSNTTSPKVNGVVRAVKKIKECKLQPKIMINFVNANLVTYSVD